MTVKPFRIEVPEARLDRIRSRLQDAEWPDMPEGEPWAYGASGVAMRDLVGYWLEQYDWRSQERMLNEFPHFIARVEDYDVHFIHAKGSGANPKSLLISHGWPGSFVEFLKVIDPLTHPERHGGDAADAFSVVVPSLLGYGFSSKPKKPIGPRTIARVFDTLMTATLGYTDYIAQGGDWGSAISGWLGFEGKGCTAIHLNMVIGWTPPDVVPETEAEKAAAANWQNVWRTESGYMVIQMTKPLSLSYAMNDSPLGAAAWIFEKFRTWSQLKDGDPWSVYSRDEILNNIMIYLVTSTFGTASWLYRGVLDEPIPAGARVTKPVAVAVYPGELVTLPKSQVERMHNVVRWTELSVGGHFAAMEQPAVFVDEMRRFGRQLQGR